MKCKTQKSFLMDVAITAVTILPVIALFAWIASLLGPALDVEYEIQMERNREVIQNMGRIER